MTAMLEQVKVCQLRITTIQGDGIMNSRVANQAIHQRDQLILDHILDNVLELHEKDLARLAIFVMIEWDTQHDWLKEAVIISLFNIEGKSVG